jgi:hypothetical protein
MRFRRLRRSLQTRRMPEEVEKEVEELNGDAEVKKMKKHNKEVEDLIKKNVSLYLLIWDFFGILR